MTISADAHDRDAANPGGTASAAIMPVFVASLFLSAFLLFGVQPMFTRMVLPTLGGTPAVWSVAMVFFQALLLGGYAYAHLLVARLGLRGAALIHLCVMAAALACQPIAMASGWGRPPSDGEAIWLLGLFAVSVGLPFFAISANGPLLQAWFARSGHRAAADPYFLYAASNIGSFAALAAYPFLIEPTLTLAQQSRAWTGGFLALSALIGACALLSARGRPAEAPADATAPSAATGPATERWRERARWVGLSFVPSGLLVAVTAHISTDVASAPLLWVVPLALFLLTFVLAFRDSPFLRSRGMERLVVWFVGAGLFGMVSIWPLWLSLPVHLGLFLLVTLAAHHALYRSRPDARRLTEFYMWMSFGGVLGGAFCGLLAPHVFPFVAEYPLLLLAGLLCLPGAAAAFRDRSGPMALLFAGSLALVVLAVLAGRQFGFMDSPRYWATVALVFALMLLWRRPERTIPLAAATVAVLTLLQPLLTETETRRSFFGVHKIAPSPDGRFRVLQHGTTIHGAIRIANDDGTPATGRPEPATYYTPEGGIGQAIAALRAARGGLPRVAAIGLGSGSLACHVRPGEAWTFLEIDPDVVRLAEDPAMFRFLRDCPPAPVPVVLGDARLTMADQPGGHAAIIVDAFSSDAIPAHLVTREAIGLYLDKLDPAGAIVVHISNRHLDLRHILARAGAEHGLKAYVIQERPVEPLSLRYRAPTVVVVMVREPAHAGAIATAPDWSLVPPDMTRRPWTDDFSQILEAIRDKARR